MGTATWISPFYKQCFVCLGVTLNSMEVGLVQGFTSVLIVQLKTSQVFIIDDTTASWLASIPAISLFIGILITPVLMAKFGRRAAGLTSALISTICWLSMCFANNIKTILIIKFLQGFPLGFMAILGPVLLGEYSSPKYRGMFTACLSIFFFSGPLFVHALGSMLSWDKTALVCAGIAFIDAIIIMCSPESPSGLAAKGNYDECRKSFHWLRGLKEEEELEKMIKHQLKTREFNHQTLEVKKSISTKIFEVLKRREIYRPIVIMLHLNIVNEWSGNALYDAYTYDIYSKVVGSGQDVASMILASDIQRIVTSAFAIFLVRRLKRRLMFYFAACLNIIAYLTLAGYVYGKTYGKLPYDYPFIGATLINLLLFSTAIGTNPLANTISGEIFPLAFKGTCSTIAMLFYTVNVFLNLMTAPFLFSSVGLHGVFCISACMVTYGTVVTCIMLPETKGRTLQSIEDEFIGNKLCDQETTVPMNPQTCD